MKGVEIVDVAEKPEGISVIMVRSGKQYNYFKDWNGKEELWLEKDGGTTKLYSSYRLICAARKAHGFPSTKP